MIVPFTRHAVNAGNNDDCQNLTSFEEKLMDVNILVLETPGTDAVKFLKRFFDKSAPYYEKGKNGEITSILDNDSFQPPKRFDMIAAHLCEVDNWETFSSQFYRKIDDRTFAFECKFKLETVDSGKELYVYNTTFKIFHINSIDEINNPEIVNYIDYCSGIFELFDLKNKHNFFNTGNIKAVIDGIRQINSEHYDMPILDNCEMDNSQFQQSYRDLDQYFLDECCNYTLFNHNTGNGAFLANWNFVSRGALWYPKKKVGMNLSLHSSSPGSIYNFIKQNRNKFVTGGFALTAMCIGAYYGIPALCKHFGNSNN